MSTAMPQVPPRPTRSQDQKTSSSGTLGDDLPRIPPRPSHRRPDRSISPQRESFAPSPLNEAPSQSNHGTHGRPSLYSNQSANASASDLAPRPPSVALPSLGQEGSEYAEVFASPEEPSTSPTQTRNVAGDLKLHAPRPSLPTSSAKQKVSAVTRTDSGQAAAYGIGKAGRDDRDPSSRPLKAKASFASQTSNGTEPLSSTVESEHGIPEIGQRVPMYPNAGDVQAPSPSPQMAIYAPGVGFHNDGTRPKHHARKVSGRGSDIPFDAYGKHGHGQLPHDRFEKAYYEKHPELLKKETSHYHGPYAEDRPEWAMSSEDLNKIVRDTASRGAGLGTSPAVIGTPSEQIGFQASEEYTSRISSPHPHGSQAHNVSPLRKGSSPGDADKKAGFESDLSSRLDSTSDAGPESELEDENTIHIDAPGRRISRIYGGAGHLESTEDLGPHTGSGGEGDGIHDEHGYGAPILASDEVAKEPFGWELQPAVSPLHESGGSAYYDDHNLHLRSGSASSSRPTSRPGSIHAGLPGIRLPSDRPLEALDEYEPLFSEGDEEGGKISGEKLPATSDKLKRPGLKNRKFPSQDIWEDTPNSLQYTAMVSTPQLPEDTEEGPRRKHTEKVETPEQAFARRQEELAEKESEDSESFLNREHQPWPHMSHTLAETRLGMKQRFPSRDIWEDTPDSLKLQATVAGPQSEEKEALAQPADGTGVTSAKPPVPARPTRTKSSESPERTGVAIPRRRPSENSRPVDSNSPPLPIKAKPQIPARPSKPITRNSSEHVPLETVPSNSSAKSSGSDQGVAAKPKPPAPSRPVGSKIAALQNGFMLDLNKRLQLGPHAPPKKEDAPSEEPESEKEKAPLADARKGRAKGPARRAPAKNPAPPSHSIAANNASAAFGLSAPYTLWQMDPEEGLLDVPSRQQEAVLDPETKPSQPEAPAGSAADRKEQSFNGLSEVNSSVKNLASQPPPTEAHVEHVEEVPTKIVLADVHDDNSESGKSSCELPITSQDTVETDIAGKDSPVEARASKPSPEEVGE